MVFSRSCDPEIHNRNLMIQACGKAIQRNNPLCVGNKKRVPKLLALRGTGIQSGGCRT